MTHNAIQQAITLVNIYALITDTPKYTRKILRGINGEIDSNTVIVVNCNILLTSMDRSSK